MKQSEIKRTILFLLKTLIALAAAANLIALFVYRYEMPSWLRHGEESEEPVAESGPLPTEEPVSETEHLVIPVVPVNYSGEADLDGMIRDGVYLMGSDGQPVDEAEIRYEIRPGDSLQKKIVRYAVDLEDGSTLTEDRDMNLTSRYTGPSITLMGALPEIDPAEADNYVARLAENGIIRAVDGFGNDATNTVEAVFQGLSDEEPESDLTLRMENQVKDTYELEFTVRVKDFTGVVLTLTQYHLTLSEGDEFNPSAYVGTAHDRQGNDLTERVTVDSDVDTSVPGDYEVWFWVEDGEGVYSPTRVLYVTVEGAPEEAAETEEAP